MKNKILILLLLLLPTLNKTSLAKEQIDAIAEKCAAKASTHFEANNCLGTAINGWSVKIDYYYKLLYSILTPEGRQKLKISQQSWVNYRDITFKFIDDAPYPTDPNMIGTAWIGVLIGYKTDIVRKRALELKMYYEDFKNAK